MKISIHANTASSGVTKSHHAEIRMAPRILIMRARSVNRHDVGLGLSFSPSGAIIAIIR